MPSGMTSTSSSMTQNHWRQVIGAFGAGGKAARAAAVFELRGVDDAVGAALCIG